MPPKTGSPQCNSIEQVVSSVLPGDRITPDVARLNTGSHLMWLDLDILQIQIMCGRLLQLEFFRQIGLYSLVKIDLVFEIHNRFRQSLVEQILIDTRRIRNIDCVVEGLRQIYFYDIFMKEKPI